MAYYNDCCHSRGNINGNINDDINALKSESAQKILELILKNPRITQDEIVSITSLSKRTVSRVMKSLKDSGVIVREGSNKNGYWKII